MVPAWRKSSALRKWQGLAEAFSLHWIHPTSPSRGRGSSRSPCMSQAWGHKGHMRLCKAVAVTSGIMGCPELGKALEPTPVWGKQPQLAPDMEPNWQVPWTTWNHNTVDEFEASTGGFWFNPPTWRNTKVQWGISLCPALTVVLGDRRSEDLLGGPVPLQISSKVWTGAPHPSNTPQSAQSQHASWKLLIVTVHLRILLCFDRGKERWKPAAASTAWECWCLCRAQVPSVSPWFWHMCGCHRGKPPGMRTPWYDEVWGLQGGDGRRAGEQTQREHPFGEEQKNPLALLVFLPPSCASYRAYHSGAVGYKQPSPALKLWKACFSGSWLELRCR